MADPILPDYYRAQFIMRGPSGLPEDVFVNNFVFRNNNIGSTPAGFADDIKAALQEFYSTAVNTPNSGSQLVSTYLTANRNDVVDVVVYDLGQTPPRSPIKRSFTMTKPTATTTGPPEEVAVCLSYYAGRPLPRYRGRIYLGPLTASAVAFTAGKSIVTEPFRQALGASAARLMARPGMSWCVLSPTRGEASIITGGWVDNAFDTQRRRGVAPSARSLWGAAPVTS